MSKRVLVVDDEPSVVRVLRSALELEGFGVSTAANGAECLLAAEANLPDLIVLDLNMPVMDGFQTLRVLRDKPETRSIPVIVLTARVEDADVVQALMTGADLYLMKPFEAPELLAAVNRLLETGRPEGKARS